VSRLKWGLHTSDEGMTIPLADPEYPSPVLQASILAKSGALGTVVIVAFGGKYYLEASSDTTGRDWQVPADRFGSIDEAKKVADKLWRPAFTGMPD
jgi:hypothetical protein